PLSVSGEIFPELSDALVEGFIGNIPCAVFIRIIHTDYRAVFFSNLQISDRGFHKTFIDHLNQSLYMILNPFSYRFLTARRKSMDAPAETASTDSTITISE